MAKLTLYTNPQSRGQIAHWMMEEIGEPYETIWLEYGELGTKSQKFLAVNPMGKIPTIVHDGHVVTEAAAICLYLAAVFPKADLLAPADRLADYFRWTFFAAGPVEQAVTAKAMNWDLGNRSAMLGFGSFDATIAALTGHLERNQFVCGDKFTAADVYVGSTVEWGLLFKTIPTSLVLKAYADRVGSRPQRQRARAFNEEHMAKKKK